MFKRLRDKIANLRKPAEPEPTPDHHDYVQAIIDRGKSTAISMLNDEIDNPQLMEDLFLVQLEKHFTDGMRKAIEIVDETGHEIADAILYQLERDGIIKFHTQRDFIGDPISDRIEININKDAFDYYMGFLKHMTKGNFQDDQFSDSFLWARNDNPDLHKKAADYLNGNEDALREYLRIIWNGNNEDRLPE